MKLTKKERNKHYVDVYEVIRNGSHIGSPFMCNVLSSLFQTNIEDYPELIKKRPLTLKEKDGRTYETNIYGAWFRIDQVKERLKILRACIRETAPKPRKK